MNYDELFGRFITLIPRYAGRANARELFLNQMDLYAQELVDSEGVYIDDADADARFYRDLYSRDEMLYLLELSDARD